MDEQAILIISDTHKPYDHIDATAFLKELKNEFKPTRVIHIGDEVDYHTISFHDKDPDTDFSPSSELKASIASLQGLYELFPKLHIMESNHGSLVYRRQKYHGIPRAMFKSYKEILKAPRGWTWHEELKIDNTLFKHHVSSNITEAVKNKGCNVVQGHNHTIMDIDYVTYGKFSHFGMTVGCLIDRKAMVYRYANANLALAMLGTGVIYKGRPMLFPMKLNNKGRWTGDL